MATEMTYFFSLVNRNLFPEAPQNTAMFSPNIEVLKRYRKYLLILSLMNISGVLVKANSNVSPMTGHPVLPGGNLARVDFCLNMRKMSENEIQGTTRWNRFGKKSISPSTIIRMSKKRKGNGQELASSVRIYIGAQECTMQEIEYSFSSS